MSETDFYEDDEPIEDIRRILARPADGITAAPRRGCTMFYGVAEDGTWSPLQPTESSARVLLST